MRSDEIRQKFLEFFEKNGHTIVPSSSLIPAFAKGYGGRSPMTLRLCPPKF